MKRLLSIGQFSAYGVSNTCLHRNWALHQICETIDVDSTKDETFGDRLRRFLFSKLHLPVKFSNKKLNDKIINVINNNNFDIVWIDKGLYIDSSTLQYIRKQQPNCKIIGYSPDNMVERHNQSQNFLEGLSLYDYYITTKSYIVEELKRLGAKNVLFVNNAYESKFHYPYNVEEGTRKRLGGMIGFIGSWEKERCESILFLAKNNIPIRIWGDKKWQKYKGLYPSLQIEDNGLFSEDYFKALSSFDISLCFLRKMNHDLQTTRTMEIPACGSLLMAERTSEHEQLFIDRKEAVFFSSNEELLEACNYYLNHKEERISISKAGLERCKASGYSNKETITRIINIIFDKK